MVFTSHIFLFGFLPLALLLYFLTPVRWRSLTLTVVSYVFYGWWNPWFTILMLGSTLLDYQCGRVIAKEDSPEWARRLGLYVSVVANLGVLAFFKYALFFSESANSIAGWMGWQEFAAPEFLRNIVLPVGISFYTFQSMSYSIDLFRGHARAAKSFVDFACYVSLFPQLVAGPIVRYGAIAEQIRDRKESVEGFVAGFTRFNFGFAKKVLLANPMGAIADLCFEAGAGSLSPVLAWVGVLAYAFQIYFDFSAYSDMALGLGRMLGFRFPENFDSPYKSRSITEFWRRWHISLSSFLRDYLYIPLGGNRKGRVRTYVNLFLVMLIGGLWHGAQWTFVIWGGIHGVWLAIERFCKGRVSWALPGSLQWAITFVVLLITWVFFRAESLDVALSYLSAMFGATEIEATSTLLADVVFRPAHLVQLGVALLFAFFLPNTQQFLQRVSSWKVILGLLLLFGSVRILSVQGFNPFLYFQF